MLDAIPAAAAAARCIEALPDDVIVEILARVPDALSLFRCAVVCRRWRRLVADPAFLLCRRAWPDGDGSSLIGFFVLPQKLVYDEEGYSSLAPTGEGLALVPAPGPGAAAGSPPSSATTTASSTTPVLSRPATASSSCASRLAPARRTASSASDGYSSFFQVLLTGVRSNDLQVYLARFSSDSAATQAWYWRCVPVLSAGPYGSRVAAVTSGIAHWVFIGTGPNGNGMQILHVSISTGHVCATEIPFHVLPDLIQPDWSNTWLCPSIDGWPLFFYLDDNQLRIWSRQDDEDGDYTDEVWHLTQAIPLGTELGLSGIKSLSTVCIGEKSSTMLVLNPDSGHPYVLHLRSRSSTMVAGWKQSFNYVPAVPYEMNWSEFFMSRLGVQQ
ncbi:hypothetical protein PR202_ga27522 [Eleusine coracana subsp. coracana]|uniref:F-box domain-containing protein n=1 Tax=Eleusine coracana subsp. coracana TaxID=191504 RepID=A0AAV5DET8_ELECO|nr:hypothetical protein QOZ80_8AG0621070 [Eleusine coracana subsp. coracana]GJN09509.1 hypothetical protein PR202_ga27522 [Eleusine coracana subsp. coracana]